MATSIGKRLAIAFAALFMMTAFIIIILIGVVMALVFIVGYILSDSAWLRDRLTKFGQSIDAAANVVLLDGHPKETISSHVGRIYSAKYGNPIKNMPVVNPNLVIPWPAPVVKWITNFGEKDHVYHAVESWAVEQKVPV